MPPEDALDTSQDDVPTRAIPDPPVDGPPSRTSTPASLVSGGITLELPKPETVLRRSELEETHRTAVAGLLFNAAGLAIAPFIGGDTVALRCAVVGLAIALVNNGWLWFVSNERRYRQRWLVVYFLVAPVPNTLVLWYFGVFSPLLAMFVLNVYTACIAYHPRVARITLVASIVPIVLLGGLVALGVLRDPGIISAGPLLGPAGKAGLVLGSVVFLVLTYAQASRSRQLLAASLVERDAAVRAASHREAMFLEARQDLERALQAGGLGRFTDQTLGSFKLGGVIGRGGMGEVYEAVHMTSGVSAALKMLRSEAIGRSELVRRFLREVRVAASLDSPHVVRVLEIGDESAPMPYLAMERLHGADLGQILRDRERLGGAEVVDLVRQVGRGIEAAHRAGIVHRDIKPQNLFLTDDTPPVWKILDFGISKLTRTSDTLTRGEAIGTPHYMAPEQAKGQPVDPRTDFYALGAIAYRSLTGHQPFAGDETPAVLLGVISHMPVRPTALADLPPAIDLVLAVALAKRPDDRFQSAEDLAIALELAFGGAMDPSVRRRAARALRRHPWGEPAA